MMDGLFRKDLPWIGGVTFAGMMAMVLSLHTTSFVHTFVVTPRHYEELFYTAWPSGMLLGVVAACFDEVLGTREFLAQRPVSLRSITGSRFLACTIVLVLWFLAVPFFAYAAFVFDRHWEVGHWQRLPSIWATMTPVVSGCALGLAAGSLPFAWWVRLWWLAAGFLTSFSAIHWLECGIGRLWSSLPWFVGGHLALAVVASVVAIVAARVRRDPDRPLTPGPRAGIVAPLLAVGAILAGVLCGHVSDTWVRGLHAAYPDALEHGGRIVLSNRDREQGRVTYSRHVVDERHLPTGERLAPMARRALENRPVWGHPDFLRVEDPRWPAATWSGYSVSGSIIAEPDGRVLWCPHGDRPRPLHWVVKPDGSAFAPGALVCGRDVQLDLGIVEPGAAEIWAFDAENHIVRAVPLPDGDRVQGVTAVHQPADVVGAPAGFEFRFQEQLVRGERGVYALRGGKLVAAGTLAPREERKDRNLPARIEGQDPLTWTLVFDGADGVQPFRHTFTPRTFDERASAALALMTSVLRPPALQVAAALAPADAVMRAPQAEQGPRWWWLFDPLVAGGRRLWLVLASFAFALLLAGVVRWRLRRLGVDAATTRFWTIATLLLGVVGALASELCETKRRWSDRRVPIPAAPPRIATPEPTPETVA